jgi:hypothetical protein
MRVSWTMQFFSSAGKQQSMAFSEKQKLHFLPKFFLHSVKKEKTVNPKILVCHNFQCFIDKLS